MEPNNIPTIHDPQPIAGQGMPVASVPMGAPGQPVASNPSNPVPVHGRGYAAASPDDEGNIEPWLKEVQEALQDTSKSPRQRAAHIADIKARYQEQVLGIKLQPKAF